MGGKIIIEILNSCGMITLFRPQGVRIPLFAKIFQMLFWKDFPTIFVFSG